MTESKNIKVLKFGGTSVKNPQRLAHVAQIVSNYSFANKTIVVVSAMGEHTDSLVQLAALCADNPDRRELDVLLSCGEQQSIALLSIILKDRGIKAKSFTGAQIGIVTEANYGNAEILSIDKKKILEAFEENDVIVVAGFQGVTTSGDITTLGRGGSDTSAVAIAAVVGAEECEIYTDVDGIFTADPNIINGAIQHESITYEDCLELAANGAQVIHPRAVECARENGLNVRIRNVFNANNRGTVVCETVIDQPDLTGIALSSDYAALELQIDDTACEIERVESLVYSAVGKVNVKEKRKLQGAGTSLIYILSGTNKTSGEAILNTLAKEPGIVVARIGFYISKLAIVGQTATTLCAEIYPSLQSLCYQAHPLVFLSSEINTSVYLDSARALEVWNLLHQTYKGKFVAKKAQTSQNNEIEESGGRAINWTKNTALCGSSENSLNFQEVASK